MNDLSGPPGPGRLAARLLFHFEAGQAQAPRVPAAPTGGHYLREYIDHIKDFSRTDFESAETHSARH